LPIVPETAANAQSVSCSVWDDGDVGVTFRALRAGEAMTLRASAAGMVLAEAAPTAIGHNLALYAPDEAAKTVLSSRGRPVAR
jgi:hypothetical protein